ncbi:MAG: hypothetical protein ACTHZ9_11665, partial [Leucobacter sp.]
DTDGSPAPGCTPSITKSRITESAQRYVAAKRRLRADEDRQRKHEERMRTVGEKEESRLEAQERAQNWLYGGR